MKNCCLDIVNWSFAEFLDYFEIVIDTNPVDFIASMQVPCFHEAVVELVNVLKKKSRKIVRDAKKWEKLEKQIQKELEQGKVRIVPKKSVHNFCFRPETTNTSTSTATKTSLKRTTT